MSLVADLRIVLRGRDFRRLYATRLTSQIADGVFQVGVAGYVFFSPEQQTRAGEAALAAAVLLLPYSLAGPFAGIFLDRWRRRQILVWAPRARALVVGAAALLLAFGHDQVFFYLAALVALGINRFFLSALGASLPRVVRADELVMGNSVSTTSGTLVTFAGAGIGFGLRLAFGSGKAGAALILLAAAACYIAASFVATTLDRDRLGPDLLDAGRAKPAGAIAAQLAEVARGLREGARHVWAHRPAALALGVMAAHRFLYGIATIMTVLLFRNYFHSDADAGLNGFALALGASAAGYFLAAIVTPAVTPYIRKETWITVLLTVTSVALAVLATPFTEALFVAGAFALGLTAQGVKLCVDTILQESVADAFRGRIFAYYDMIFNGIFVLGFFFAALTLPTTGRSPAVLAVVIGGYALTALGYGIATKGPRLVTT